MAFFAVIVLIHASVLLAWAEWVNRKYYRWDGFDSGPRPPFKPLPASLKFPNLEVSVMVIFSSGIVESATAIIGAWAGDAYEVAAGDVSLALIALSFVGAFYVWQLLSLARFWSVHAEVCWSPGETPAVVSQVSDPIFALLWRLRVDRQALDLSNQRHEREIGEWLAPDSSEPERTERALHQFFWCSRYAPKGKSALSPRQQRSGDQMEMLKQWLSSSSGVSARALWYQAFQVVLTLLISVATGLLFAHPVGPSQAGQVRTGCGSRFYRRVCERGVCRLSPRSSTRPALPIHLRCTLHITQKPEIPHLPHGATRISPSAHTRITI